MTRLVTGPYGTFHAWNQDLVGQIISTGKFWDAQIKGAIDEADPTGTAIDLGANIGWFTVYMAKRFAKVIAVEAHPGTYELLVKNTLMRDADVRERVLPINAAAYDRTTTLHLAPESWLGWPVPSETDLDQVPNADSLAFVPTGEGLAVPAYPIDIIVDTIVQSSERVFKDWPKVTCIKVDCQGCDLRALVGLTETIARDRPLVIFEFEREPSSWHGDAWEDYEAFFAAHRYTVTRVRADLGDYVARPIP